MLKIATPDEGPADDGRAAIAEAIRRLGPAQVRATHGAGDLLAMRTAAALCSLVAGLGFGIPCAFGIRHFVRTGEVWTFMGLPTYGGGPFERWGLHSSVWLLTAFLVVCVAEVVLGVMIWADVPGAKSLGLVLLPIELVFWVGFALPFGPLLGITRTVLVFLI